MAEIYYINNTDLSTLLTIQRVDATAHAPTMLQQDYLVPGRTGAVPVKPWFGPSPLMIGGLVQGATRPLYLDRIAQFISLCVNSGQPFTMKRTLPRATGSNTATAQARYVGGLDYVEQISDRVARVMVEFSILSSFWSDENFTSLQTQAAGSFSVQVPGDIASNDIIATFSGGTGQRLTNTTTGDYVEIDVSTSASPAVLNIANFTALQGSTNIIDKVTPNPANRTQYWITLQPGANNLVLTGGGSVAIQYKGFFL
jgi:hypothetical protein